MKNAFLQFILTIPLALGWIPSGQATGQTTEPSAVRDDPREKHLRNIRQLTFGGENAEAYFSFDGTKVIFQSTRDGLQCDQIFILSQNRRGEFNPSTAKRVSTGKGRTTCGFFTKNGKEIIYASTHLAHPACPTPPDRARGYVWKLYDTFDIFRARADGSNLRRLTETPGYDAEAVVSPDGKRIVFTSMRDGDPEIYTMNLDGKNVKRLTHQPGYDGGPFFSHNGKKIVYRANRPKTEQEIADYQQLIKDGLIRPMALELYVMDADGSNPRQITANGKANFAPYFFPNDRRIIFASNMGDPRGRKFELYAIDTDGKNLERLTYSEDFNSFPMFSPDGKKLIWASNRNAKKHGETNLFIADWVD